MSVRIAVSFRIVGSGFLVASTGVSSEVDLTTDVLTYDGKKADYVRINARQVRPMVTPDNDGIICELGVAAATVTDVTGIYCVHGHPIVLDAKGYASLYIINTPSGQNVSAYITPVEPVFI